MMVIVMDSLFSILFFLFTFFIISSFASQPSYKDHCSSIIQESTPQNLIQNSFFPFGYVHKRGYFTGGSRIIQKTSLNNNYSSFSLYPRFMHATQNSDLFKIEAIVSFNTAPITGNYSYYDHSHKSTYKGQRHRRFVTLRLDGFWSQSSGKVCMVGTGSGYSKTGDSLNMDVVFKLSNVFNASNISSLVSGSLESLSSEKDENYFEPFSVFMFPRLGYNYNYTLDSKEVEKEFSNRSDKSEKSLSFNFDSLSLCQRVISRIKLEYSHECSSLKNCNPLGGSSGGHLPTLVSFKKIECSLTKKQSFRVVMKFSYAEYLRERGLNPKTTLVGEGWWDEKKNVLCVVACHVISMSSSSSGGTRVGDCSIRLRLRFPSVWSIKNTNSIVGEIWSNKTANDPDYFKAITLFRNNEDGMFMFRVPKYDYSQLERVTQSCPAHKNVKNKGRRYPDAYSYNMRFDMTVGVSNRRVGWGYSAPFYVGDQVYSVGDQVSGGFHVSQSKNASKESDAVIVNNSSLFNISYKISFSAMSTLDDRNSVFNLSSSRVKISAEGIYDAGVGTLCMIGCRELRSEFGTQMAGSVDCEILLKFQLPELDSTNGTYIEGTIKSTRKKSDPLYFKSLELSSASVYKEEIEKVVWRMDMEIIMVLISTTLACLFVGLQLYHVKRHPDVLRFISVIMMSILTFGYMIPLVLNFEALVAQNPDNKNFVFGNVGWLEVNEIAVRLITMVAFLLQFRLLQLTWSSRKSNEGEKGLWAYERMASYVIFPLYASGLLIALLFKLKKDGEKHAIASIGYQQHHSSWENMKSYGGLVLDGFLLPQIILNLFSNMKDNVLSCSFYFGTTFVRLLPHAYDLYRTRNYARQGKGSYFYADPSADFYSTAWDIAIPLGGILFAVTIYLQQRFGAQYILPDRFGGSKVYEKVPVVTESEVEVMTANS